MTAKQLRTFALGQQHGHRRDAAQCARMIVVGADDVLDRIEVLRQQFCPFVAIAIGARHTVAHAPAFQLRLDAIERAGIGAQPVHRQPMRGGEEPVDLLLPVHLSTGQAASLDKSATRFIAACNCASKPSRLARSAGSSALTITDSKNASTGPV